MTQTTIFRNLQKSLCHELVAGATGADDVAAICMALPAPTGGAAAAPLWIQLMPLGVTDTRDGRRFDLKDAAAVAAASLSGGDSLLIDYDHATDLNAPGTPNPAAGWITELSVRADGLYGKVDWSDAGAVAVASKAYRFVSPVFMHDSEDGTVHRIVRVSLTNIPALPLKALAHAHSQKSGERDMDFLAQLRAALGVKADADEKTVLAQCAALVKTQSDIKAAVGEDEADLVKAVASLKTKAASATGAAAAVDESKFVAVEKFDELQKSLASLQKERATEKAVASVDTAIASGQITPAQKDWALSYCTRDPQGFADFVKAQPVVVAPGAGRTAALPAADDATLDADEKAICSQLGISEAAYLKQRTAERKSLGS
jgi:phage I-like protein